MWAKKKKVNFRVCEREITLSLFFLLKKHIFCNTFPSLATYVFPICIIYLYKERKGGTFFCLFVWGCESINLANSFKKSNRILRPDKGRAM